ncbi:6-pyruvoyl-tetrahydropterin synthase-related protein [Desertimonas flava]|uniref:6-pyruvoyl-tetrahydropterin synthase-related protein n=1 Tax=Desertimonas flava TaxID=2064846 RepID=UPI000E35087D|nr:6-pyruvoyl-tetrahydropterin synthase-related protein [Desertimonas flava]
MPADEAPPDVDPDAPDFAEQFDRVFGPPSDAPSIDQLLAAAPAASTELVPASTASTASSSSTSSTSSTALVPAPPPWTDPDPTPPVPEEIERPRPLAARAVLRVLRRPLRWARAPWPADRIVRTLFTAATLAVTTWVMMRVIHFNPLYAIGDRVSWLGWLRNVGGEDLIFLDSTPAGGDMGAHVWTPAYLRDHLIPNGQLSGWSMDWYAGLPVYRFYMVTPALAIVMLDSFLPYGVAFKVVAMSGMLSLPFCCWAFGRLARFRYPMPELFAFAGLCFVLNESYYLLGGNVKSTMAGEFSFSIAISCMMLGLGLLIRGLETGKHMAWAAAMLALACLSHGIVLIYTAIAAMAIVACRSGADVTAIFQKAAGPVRDALRQRAVRRFLYALGVGGLAVALSAFWVGPFLFNHQYMTETKYAAEPSIMYSSFWEMLFDQKLPLDIAINTLAVVGVVLAVVRRHVYTVAIGISMAVGIALVYLTRDSLPLIGLLWNPRVLPFVYLVRYLLMMIGAFEVVSLAANVVRNRPARTPASTAAGTIGLATSGLLVLIVIGFAYQVLPGGGFITDDGERVYAWGPIHAPAGETKGTEGEGWTAYNFRGYEAVSLYPEYHDLIQTMAGLGDDPTYGCGRALYENNSELNKKYGSSFALQLLPFWTDGCIGSSEGVYFEASGTTPYHFLTSAAMSDKSSHTVRQLRYTDNDAAVGVPYLQALGIRYLMVRTEDAVAEAAEQPELTEIATSGPWHIYQVADSDIVVPLTVQPVVVNPRGGDQRERHLELGTSWFQHRDEWAALPADSGPAEWQRIDVEVDEDRHVDNRVDIVQPVQEIDPVALDPVVVSNVDIGEQSVEFDVDRPGVPILVRVSYFPNWTVEGADGPYRVAPNFMVVVPTDTHVRLDFGRSTLDLVFNGVTLLGIVLAVVAIVKGPVRFTPQQRN